MNNYEKLKILRDWKMVNISASVPLLYVPYFIYLPLKAVMLSLNLTFTGREFHNKN